MALSEGFVLDTIWRHYADQYRDGATVADISRRVNRAPSTVVGHMKRLKVYQPGRKGGPPKLDECQRGHDMEKHAKWVDEAHPEKGRYCSECKRERERQGE